MGRLLTWLALLLCLLAVFLSLDSFAPMRAQLSQNIPDGVKQFCSQMQTEVLGLVALFSKQERLFTKDELYKRSGESGDPVYLAVLGRVYDVTRGKKHYGPGGGYSFFSGRDGSRAFVTGDFTEKGLTDDVSGFTTSEALSLEEWDSFYKKDYTYVGKVVGNFYDSEGKPTKALTLFEDLLQKALAERRAEEDFKKIFPPCNTQWSQGGHVRVWCTNRSGGIQRDWVGVPRQYFQPGKVQDRPRCVCVKNSGPPSGSQNSQTQNNRGDLDNPNMKLYDGCDVNAESCTYIKDEN